MAEADRLAIAAGTPGRVLMQRAGVAIADAVARGTPLGAAVVVLCGPGNNGGDGYVAARVLRDRGFRVTVAADGPPNARAPDAVDAAEGWGRTPLPLARWDHGRVAVVIDALYGAGLSRPIDRLTAEVIAAVNAHPCRVVAADIPSGVDGATGAVRGAAIQADETVTFFRRKPGHLLMPAGPSAAPCAWSTSASARPFSTASALRTSPMSRPSGADAFPSRTWRDTNTAAAMRWWSPAA